MKEEHSKPAGRLGRGSGLDDRPRAQRSLTAFIMICAATFGGGMECKMSYSIGEVADATGIAISTLRYYDREGLFPNMGRSGGGIRVFSDTEIEAIRIIECLKTSGMPIKDIKQFLDWCQEGDASLQKRRDMFYERLDAVTKQMEDLQKTMDIIRYKCWYYDTALAAGTEDAPKNTPVDEMPEDIKKYRQGYLEHL